MDDMDLYDRRILAVLRDGRSRKFQQILSKVEFSYNTLRLHLAQLVEHGLVVKRKRPQQGPGRPRFAYALPKGVDGHARAHRSGTCSRVSPFDGRTWDSLSYRTQDNQGIPLKLS